MSFVFDPRINPTAPLDPNDPAPTHWVDIETSDHRAALFGFASETFEGCSRWEVRELRRWRALNPKTLEGFTTNTLWESIPGMGGSLNNLELVDVQQEPFYDEDGASLRLMLYFVTSEYGKLIKIPAFGFRTKYREKEKPDIVS